MLMSQGQQLKKYLRVNDITVDSLKSIMGVSRQTIYNWFEQAELEGYVIEKLKKANINISEFEKTITDKSKGDFEAIQKENELLRELLKSKEELIELLRSQNKGSDYSGKRKVS